MLFRILGAFLLGILLIGTGKAEPLDEATTALGQGDFGGAFRILGAFAERGVPEAQFSLGELYAAGRGTPKDEAEAVRWYLKAAKQGERDASYALGIMYGTGQGVPQDSLVSADWFMLAAQQGNVKAQYAVGVRYATGMGFERDEAVAARWMDRAAEQGLAVAQIALASMAASGRGMPRSNFVSYSWASIAEARLADEKLRGEADGLRRAVSSFLTPEQIGQVQDVATKWRPTLERPTQSVETVNREESGIETSLNIRRGEAVVSWRFVRPRTTPLSEISGTIDGQTLGIPHLEPYPQPGATTSVLFLIDTSDRSSQAQIQQDTLTVADIVGHAQAHHQIDVATYADTLNLLVSDKTDVGSLLGLVQSVPPQGSAGSFDQILQKAIEVSTSTLAERRGIFVLIGAHSDGILHTSDLIEKAKRAGVSLTFIFRPSEPTAELSGLEAMAQATDGEVVKEDRFTDFMKSPFALLDSGATVHFSLNHAPGDPSDPDPDVKVILQYGGDHLEIVSKVEDNFRLERDVLEDVLRSCGASCANDFRMKIQERLDLIQGDEHAFKAAQNDLERLRSYIRECHSCVFRDEAQTWASDIEMQRLYAKLEAAGLNREALKSFISECGASCPESMRTEVQSRQHMALLEEQEEESYESARGDFDRLRNYVATCSICAHANEACQGIQWKGGPPWATKPDGSLFYKCDEKAWHDFAIQLGAPRTP